MCETFKHIRQKPKQDLRGAQFTKLSHYSIYIAAFSKTQLANKGSVAEPKGGYIFFWNGKTQDSWDRTSNQIIITQAATRTSYHLQQMTKALLSTECFPIYHGQ